MKAQRRRDPEKLKDLLNAYEIAYEMKFKYIGEGKITILRSRKIVLRS